MYRIALVQNQSEMNHYRYANLKDYIKTKTESKRYEFVNYTAHNITDLARELDKNGFQAVIFATNAFNDTEIYKAVQESEFVEAFSRFMNAGNGCLVLNQIKVAQNQLPLDFLQSTYGNEESQPPKLILRNTAESVEKANLRFCGERHLLTLYPNEISLDAIKKNCLNAERRVGYYWHYLSGTSDLWDVVIEDKVTGAKRPLVIATKDDSNYRIAISSLLLDWQKNYDLLDNLICWITEKRHLTAILEKEGETSVGFSYFTRSLDAERHPHVTYKWDECDLLYERIKQDIHSLIIADPDINFEMLSCKLREIIKEKTENGKLKYIEFKRIENHIEKDLSDEENGEEKGKEKGKETDSAGEEKGKEKGEEKGKENDTQGQTKNNEKHTFGHTKSLMVSGKTQTATQLFRELESEISAEMTKSYIDGSFWSSVETLQALSQIKEKSILLDENTTQKILELAEKHNKQGSYDDVIGATGAFLWLRAKFLKDKDPRIAETLKWLTNNIERMDEWDKIAIYSTIIDLKLPDHQRIKNELKQVIDSFDVYGFDAVHLSHLIEALTLLKDENATKQVLGDLTAKLKSLQEDGRWVDTDITATLLFNLIRFNEWIKSNKAYAGHLAEKLGECTSPLITDDDMLAIKDYVNMPVQEVISQMIFDGIIYIQRCRKVVNGESVRFPFNNKISTSMKCILAWMKFDETIDIPIEETKKLLASYAGEAKSHTVSKSTVRTVETIRKENMQLLKKVEEAKRNDPLSIKNKKTKAFLLVLLFLTGYVAVMFTIILLSLTISQKGEATTTDFWATLWDLWSIHVLFVIGPIFTTYVVPLLKKHKELKDEETKSANKK